jgi:hypothetical protein
MTFVLKKRTFCFLCVIYLAHLLNGVAQEPEYEIADQLITEREEKEKIEKVTQEAQKKRFIEGLAKINYPDVLKDPDNIVLNFKYAQQQIRDNNVLGAAATLERILIIDPSIHKVRLLYAVVLFRLDNLIEAKRELTALIGEDLPEVLKDQAKEYLSKIKKRQKRTNYAIRQSFGYGFDTNRNASPSSKKRYFSNTLLPVSGTSRRRDDTNFTNATSFDVVHDLGYQAGHDVFGSFTYYLQEQTTIDSLDLQSMSYELGTNLKHKGYRLQPKFYAAHVYLSREQFLRSLGGSLLLDKTFFQRLTLRSKAKIERQGFTGITENPTAKQRDGNYFEMENGFDYVLNPTMRAGASITYGNKSAKSEINGYEKLDIDMNHTWLLGKGQFAVNSVTLGRELYDEVDSFVASRRRRGKNLRYRFTYGIPLDTLSFGKLPRFVKDVNITATYEYYRSLSNITNYTYKSNKFQLMISKRIEF